ncbi:CorA family divalent cation transporter [Brytella acorum]|uniref:Magnesium transporter n=1 Tax=Brytella acorum TaxID=2959299 RepID=A0AA35V2F8_9PROT|nr:CorA family divalent cation transporter [Brytella acorum]MDF3623482.1 CorA family divalent cation transporter [Brytella acorum]CAI9121385.1 magnesium transporter [Brytella acorum]
MQGSHVSVPLSLLPEPGDEARSGLRNGLVWAIRARPGEDPTALSQTEIETILDDATPLSNWPRVAESWVWLHFDTVHSAARAQVAAMPCLPEEVRTMLAETEYGVMIDAVPGLVWGVMPAFDDVLSEDDREICAWRFAMRPDLLITTRRNPVPVLGAAYRSLRGDAVPRSPAGIIDRAMREFTSTVRRQIGQLDDELDRAEDALLIVERRTDLGHLSGIVGKVRRRVTELRRVVVPVDHALRDDELDLPSWAEDELRDRTERQVHAALDDLLALQDRGRSLQDELASSQAEETNRRLYIVSVATTLMLPATFVTGFFGMNTGGMFLAQGGLGTVAAGVICGLAMLATWVFFKISRLL